MALIDCPECQNEVSAKAATCPKCGVQIAKPDAKASPASVLDKIAKISQVVIAVMIPLATLYLNDQYQKVEDERLEEQREIEGKRLAEQRRVNARNEKAETAIKVVDRLSDEATREAAALLALSFFIEKQLQPSVITVLAETARKDPKFFEIYRVHLGRMAKEVERELSAERSKNGENSTLSSEELEELEELQAAVLDALKAVDPEKIEGPTTAAEKHESLAVSNENLEESGSHATKGQAKQLIQVAVTEVSEDVSTGAGSSGGAEDSVTEDVTKVTEDLTRFSTDALEQVRKAETILVSDDSPETADQETKKAAGEEAIRKTNAVLEAVIEAEDEAEVAIQAVKAGTDTNPDETPSPADQAERVKEAERVRESTEMAVQTVVASIHEESRKQLRSAPLREKVFEGLDIHRIVVTYSRDDQEAEAKAIEGQIRKFLESGLDGQGKVVSVIEDLRKVEETLGHPVPSPLTDELRFQQGDPVSAAIAKRIGVYLRDNDVVFTESGKTPKSVAKREYEFWLGTDHALPVSEDAGTVDNRNAGAPTPP